MRKNELFSRCNTECGSHPLEPVVTAFSSVASSAGRYKVFSERIAATTSRLDVIQSEFIRFMFNAAINAG